MPCWPFPKHRMHIFVGIEDYRRLKAAKVRLDAWKHKDGFWVIGVRRYRRGLVIERTTLAHWIMNAKPGDHVHRVNGRALDFRRSNLVVVRTSTYENGTLPVLPSDHP